MFGFGRIKKLEENYEKLHRIVKYSKDEPTFRLNEYYQPTNDIYHPYILKNDLYIYIDKEEYIVCLAELDTKTILARSCEFRVEDNFVHFTANRYLDGIAYEFIIDYKSGTYVHKKKPINFCKEKDKEKEEPNVQIVRSFN